MERLERLGRIFGLVIAGAVSVSAMLTLVAADRGLGHKPAVLYAGGGFAAVLFPLAWLIGGRYDLLKHRSERDDLTGAFNRGFMERAFPRLAHQAMARQKRISVTIIDVNDFKEINDGYGHQAGDRVLVRLAKALQQNARHGEIVGRWGGDEFLILCPYADRGGPEALQRFLRERMEELSDLEGQALSVSVGTAVLPDDGTSFEQLAAAADRNMYTDKMQRKASGPVQRKNA